MRGEYTPSTPTPQANEELPPRARRIPAAEIEKKAGQGTTSACAENTTGWLPRPSSSRNYLRVRGEYARSRSLRAGRGELPPRARRILHRCRSHRRSVGTTSACAENTSGAEKIHINPANYLRVRGEYGLVFGGCNVEAELPPRARRIPASVIAVACDRGTTSACAENT